MALLWVAAEAELEIKLGRRILAVITAAPAADPQFIQPVAATAAAVAEGGSMGIRRSEICLGFSRR